MQRSRWGYPNFLFLNLTIGPNAKPGKIRFDLQVLDASYVMAIPLEKPAPGKSRTYARGVNSSDFIYLLMPDRFSNGDPSNDRIPGMRSSDDEHATVNGSSPAS